MVIFEPLMLGIDQFAGAGGCSIGAAMAGHKIKWAGNHDPIAIAAHQKNHPQTTHVCEDLLGYNYYDMEDFDFLMSSPSCQGHSRASQPKRRRFHQGDRAVAWGTIQCLDAKRPEWVFVENVPNMENWTLLNAWMSAIKAMGYEMEQHKLVASNHGVPQLRERLFFIGRMGELPKIEFDEPDYIPNFLDVMEETDEGWVEEKDWCKGDQVRIKAAREKQKSRTFLTQQVTNHKGVPLDQPIRTITTMDHWKVVDGDRCRKLTITELKRCMGFPDDYILPESRTKQIQLLGNAVCPPVMRDILQQTLTD